MFRVRSAIGLLLLIAICWALSRNRKAISWRVVLWGVGLQVLFGMLVLLTPAGTAFFSGVNDMLLNVMRYSEAGSKFLFGDLIFNNVPVGTGVAGGNGPVAVSETMTARTGAYFAFHVLPTIVFFSSLMAVLYHLRIMQRVVHGVAWVMQRTMGTSGAETLATSGGIFVGLMETPLLVRPYLERMTRSEVFAIMVAGLASISGGLLVAYVGMLSQFFPDIGGHLVSASFMSAPAALAVAKLLQPETEAVATARALLVEADGSDHVAGSRSTVMLSTPSRDVSRPGGDVNLPGPADAVNLPAPGGDVNLPAPGGDVNLPAPSGDVNLPAPSGAVNLPAPSGAVNLMDAAGRGANEGMLMALKVGAMLIAFLALLEMANGLFGWAGAQLGFTDLSLQRVFGYLMAPVAWIIGVPWSDARVVGELIGVKTILNEFVAFRQLADHLQGPEAISPRAMVLASYALAGFANFGSIAMQIGGMGELVPGKRSMLAQLGMRALLGGLIASLMTAAVAGVLLP